MLFFAYRDFRGRADRCWSAIPSAVRITGSSISSNRHPGLTVAELLDILEITKQSLARVLRI